jgi:hypothetical protein
MFLSIFLQHLRCSEVSFCGRSLILQDLGLGAKWNSGIVAIKNKLFHFLLYLHCSLAQKLQWN